MDLNLPEENMWGKLHDTGFGSNFFDMRIKVQKAKAKIDEQYSIKIKISLQQRKQSRVKRQPVEWEKIFTNYIYDKELLQLNRKKKSIENEKNDLNTHFSKEHIIKVHEYMKRCSRLVIIKKMQIQNHNEIPPHTS